MLSLPVRLVAIFVCALPGLAFCQDQGYQYFEIGHPSNAVPHTTPGFALIGGGADQDAAFRWMCKLAGRGNFLVLRASGTDAYNRYIKKVCPAISSVATLIITSREGARQPFVAERIRAAAALFISGGSQDNYIRFWQGTAVEDGINAAIKRGVPIGGTSAGLAVMGDYSFAALKDTVKSSEALPNPFDEKVTITRDFLHISLLDGMITDSHFVARDRLGRLVAFLARIATDGWSREPSGIGIDEKTSVLMDSDGSSRIIGSGAVYFLRAPGPPEQCAPNTPLTYRDISVYRVKMGGHFNVKTWTGEGGAEYKLSAENGVLKASLPGNQVY